MSWSQLSPVGTPFPTRQSATQLTCTGKVCEAHFVNSGTAALALAIQVAKDQHSDTAKPEVIIPAYGCPDLVAAAVFAGATPVVCDVSAAPYQYISNALSQALSGDTVAVVCPTLLGIRMDLAALKNQLPDNCLIIEDNAQWLPEPVASDEALAHEGNDASICFDNSFDFADLSITSFGRGKPVNLLGGGAVFLHNNQLQSAFQCQNIEAAPDVNPLSYNIKGRAFNVLASPFLYGGLEKLPFLGLGQTKFHFLSEIAALDSARKALLPSAIDTYKGLNRKAERKLRSSFDSNALLINTDERLLRYPLLFRNPEARNVAHKKFRHRGLGSSTFYNALLTDIPGAADKIVVPAPIFHAEELAKCLLTLPVHPGVTPHQSKEAVTLVSSMTENLCSASRTDI